MNETVIVLIIALIGTPILGWIVNEGHKRRKEKHQLAEDREKLLLLFANTLYALDGPILLQGSIKQVYLAPKRKISETDSSFEKEVKRNGMTAKILYELTGRLTDYLTLNPETVRQLPDDFVLFAYIDGEKKTIFEFVRSEDQSKIFPHHTFLFCIVVNTNDYKKYAEKFRGTSVIHD